MTAWLLLKAYLLGFVIAAPVGPVGLLCLRKNAAANRYRGVAAALGMAAAYWIIAFCVLLGMKWISAFLEAHTAMLEIFAGLVLLIMGWRGLRNLPQKHTIDKQMDTWQVVGDFSSTFGLTLLNPVPFATIAVLLTVTKVVGSQLGFVVDAEFATMIFAGVVSFWLIINQLLHMVKQRVVVDLERKISLAAGWLLIAYGVVILFAGIKLILYG